MNEPVAADANYAKPELRRRRRGVAAVVLVVLALTTVRHESRIYRNSDGVVASYSAVLLPWQSLPEPNDRGSLTSVSIRRWSLFGLSTETYSGPPGKVPEID